MQEEKKWGAFKLKGGYFYSQNLVTMKHHGIGENVLKLYEYICWEAFALYQRGDFHEMKTLPLLLTLVSKSSNMVFFESMNGFAL